MSKITTPLASVIHPGFAPALRALMQQPLSMQASFALARVSKEISAQVEIYEETRRKRISEVGEKDEAGNVEVRDPEKRALLVKEITALIEATEIRLPITNRIDVNGAQLAAAHTIYLLDIIADPNPEETEEKA